MSGIYLRCTLTPLRAIVLKRINQGYMPKSSYSIHAFPDFNACGYDGFFS
jgi:hypothetical protein